MNKRSNQHDLILGSASPRRLELLQQLGWNPAVMPVDIDESTAEGEAATDYCQRMAAEKSDSAKSISAQSIIEINLPIITADTIVVSDGQILGKPKDKKAAELTLIKLSNREHQVYSAVSVYYQNKTLTCLSKNLVKMSAISQTEMFAYIASGEPMDKAGAYGIQGYAAMWIERIEGSYSSIMGLPLFETTQLLNKLGIKSPLNSLDQ